MPENEEAVRITLKSRRSSSWWIHGYCGGHPVETARKITVLHPTCVQELVAFQSIILPLPNVFADNGAITMISAQWRSLINGKHVHYHLLCSNGKLHPHRCNVSNYIGKWWYGLSMKLKDASVATALSNFNSAQLEKLRQRWGQVTQLHGSYASTSSE